MIEIQEIPSTFLNFDIINYPIHNKSKGIESTFYDYLNKKNNTNSQLYIWLYSGQFNWTKLGKDINNLQEFCNKLNLDYPNKIFTITQYSGGPQVEIDNCLIFSKVECLTPLNKETHFISQF